MNQEQYFLMDDVYFFIFKNIYLFGYTGSQLWQEGSLVVSHWLLSCSSRALQLWLTSSLVAACRLLSCGMQTLSCSMHVGSSSLTRDRTQAPCIGSMESYPLCHQGSPLWMKFNMIIDSTRKREGRGENTLEKLKMHPKTQHKV